MILPTAKEILILNYSLTKRIQGTQGVAEINLLKAALLRPQSTFAGKELYPDLYSKAASLVEFILKGRPFESANTSTALAAGLLMLQKNGLVVKAGKEDVAQFEKFLQRGLVNVQTLAAWFKSVT